MEKTTISIHRALAELKTLDQRISERIQEFRPVAVSVKGKKIDGHITPEEFDKKSKSDFDFIQSAMSRKHSIKMAIVASNAKTKIKIGTEEMTVADAITQKSYIQQKKDLIRRMEAVNAASKRLIEQHNIDVESRIFQLLDKQSGKDQTKNDPDEMTKFTNAYKDMYRIEFHDPISYEKTIEKFKKELDEFETNVDAALSESNAITLVEI